MWIAAFVALAGCQSALGYGDITFDEDGGAAAGGALVGPATGGAGGSSAGGANAGGSGGAATGGSGGTPSGGSGGTPSGGSGGAATGGSGGTGGSSSTDPYAQYRQECVDKINALRATKGLSPYQRWTSAEACVDQQATYDEQNNVAHDAFTNNVYPACNGYGQNECPGWGPGGISACLDQMWAEKDQAGCSGCDACDTFTIFQGTCPNCSFNGSVVCGHYVNMSSKDFAGAACGFSSLGGWDAINFQ